MGQYKDCSKLYTHQRLIWKYAYLVLKLRVKRYHISQIYNNTKRPKPKENQLGILGISSREFTHFAGNSSEGLRSRREHCWGYISIFENTSKNLLYLSPKSCHNFIQWFRKRCSWSIVVTQLRLVLRLHANTSSPDVY